MHTSDRPIAFELPSEPVNIPDHLNADSFVMAISIFDPDYGDSIHDVKLDYNNEYFYYDTKLREYKSKLTDVSLNSDLCLYN